MIVFAVAGSLSVISRDVGTVFDAGCDSRRQLQPGALPPSRCAGDKRKRDGQNQEMAQNMTHAAMLTGRTGSRQQILGKQTRQYDHGEVDPFLSLIMTPPTTMSIRSNR